MVEFDNLTGLYTREAFCYHAQRYIETHPDESFDIVLSDFVNFKHFNERYGTDVGDLLLKRTGEMLAGCNVLCVRYGADQFVSLSQRLIEPAIQFLENFQLPPEANQELPVKSIVVKFGVCSADDHHAPISTLCDRAMMAVQSVKHQYGKNVGIFEDDIGQIAHVRLLIEETMTQALQNRQFEVYYQPKMDVKSHQICGAEALVRWNHPTLGHLSPGAFIPVFEENGFIQLLDPYVWETICTDLKDWQQRGLSLVPISTNMSRRDFDRDDLVQSFCALIHSYHLEPSLIQMEITETFYAEETEKMKKQLQLLHDEGIKIAMDDFGAGYTSLSALEDIPIDTLKMDISLLKKDNPANKRSILNIAIQLAKMLNLEVIQEGVETKEEMERLESLGCDVIQGYYYSKPLPKEAFESFLMNKVK